MLASTKDLLQQAEAGCYAIGGFNIYNLEGAKAVVKAGEIMRSPALLQIHPAAYRHGANGLLNLCKTYADEASVPIAVHLDHSTSTQEIDTALKHNISSVMADGSQLPLKENIEFVQSVVEKAHAIHVSVEGELGRISGTEDSLTVDNIDARMTNPDEAHDFVSQTGIDMLAVCIGNIHGTYPFPPQLDFERLKAIHQCVDVSLVLHGASGLGEDLIKTAIDFGIRKFNVNSEIRRAFVASIQHTQANGPEADLLMIMQLAETAMCDVIMKKMQLFGSVGKA